MRIPGVDFKHTLNNLLNRYFFHFYLLTSITIFVSAAYIKISAFEEYLKMHQDIQYKIYQTAVLLFLMFIVCICINGCTATVNIDGFHLGKLGERKKGQEVKYEICTEKNMPERLQKILEERKKKPGTFAYKNSRYTYLVVCYGEKQYSGYSIRVEECGRIRNSFIWKHN